MSEYRNATDFLTSRGITLEELASALGVSVQSVKQARMDPDSTGYRTPPPGWRVAVAKLARDRGMELLDFSGSLADSLDPEVAPAYSSRGKGA